MKTKLLIATLFIGMTTLYAQNIPSYVPKDGLVGYWPFNGNANDESGNNNHGVVTGASLTLDRNGKVNSAYNFDGVNNCILIQNSNTLSNNNQITISSWININKWDIQSNQGYFPIISKSNSSLYGKYRLGMYTNSNNLPSIYGNFTNSLIGISQNNLYLLNQWTHIVASITYSNFTIWINGQQVISDTTSNTGWNTTDNLPLLIGKDIPGSIEYANGKIDDIAIYNRTLTDNEIKQLYTGCIKETAISSSFNSFVFTNNSSVKLNASPTGGTFSGESVTNNTFAPKNAKLGKNNIKYNFKNSLGCADSTNFTMIMVDSIGNTCSTYDTLKIKVKLTTGIKTGQFTSMHVYPNPTSDVLIIEANDINGLKGYTYKIVDLQGKEIYKSLITASKTEIALKSIGPKGIYILHIIDEVGQTIENKKIILE